MKHFWSRKSHSKIYEVPLRSWIEKGNSKVQASYFSSGLICIKLTKDTKN
jgi:hypothetical protein